MKKKIINRLFCFLLGGIIFSGITTYAISKIASNTVSYTPEDSNWEVTNVEAALVIYIVI